MRSFQIKLSEDEFNRIQAQLESKDFFDDSDDILTDRDYIAKALVSYGSLRQSLEYYKKESERLEKQISDLDRALNFYYGQRGIYFRLRSWFLGLVSRYLKAC